MILDTNAVSALAQKLPALIDRLDRASRLAVTLISLGELSYGMRRSRYRKELEVWLREQLLTRVEILSPDLSTVEHYGDIRSELFRAGTQVPVNDLWIAALVRQHDLPLLSLDRHFDKVKGLTRIEW